MQYVQQLFLNFFSMLITPTHIVTHHSAGPDGTYDDWAGIRRYHIEERGWDDIGYHAGIELDGGVHIIRRGREYTHQGAHCPPMNHCALGFCFIGNFMQLPPAIAMIQEAVKGWYVPVMRQLDIPLSNVSMHRDHKATQCPGDAFREDVLYDAIQHYLMRM